MLLFRLVTLGHDSQVIFIDCREFLEPPFLPFSFTCLVSSSFFFFKRDTLHIILRDDTFSANSWESPCLCKYIISCLSNCYLWHLLQIQPKKWEYIGCFGGRLQVAAPKDIIRIVFCFFLLSCMLSGSFMVC